MVLLENNLGASYFIKRFLAMTLKIIKVVK